MTSNTQINREQIIFFPDVYSGFLNIFLGCKQQEFEFLATKSSNIAPRREGRLIQSYTLSLGFTPSAFALHMCCSPAHLTQLRCGATALLQFHLWLSVPQRAGSQLYGHPARGFGDTDLRAGPCIQMRCSRR